MDSIVGQARGSGESCLVLTERLTRFQLIVHAPDKTSASTVSALRALSRHCAFPDLFKTITVDNGSEFQAYDAMCSLGTEVYYCHPYTSCERGSNERNNRIIRRFKPKGKSLAKMTAHECRSISRWMNDYPRKVLGCRSPRAF